MADEQDDSQKTEEPTHKRLEDARKKGQVASSREINSFFILFVFGLIVTAFAPYILRGVNAVLFPFIARPEQIATDAGNLIRVTRHLAADIGVVMIVPVALALFAALGAGFLQNGFNASWEPLKPKLEKISPLKGLKRMFSMKSVVEFIKGILKISLVGIVGTLVIMPYMPYVPLLPSEDTQDILRFIATLTRRMIIGMLIVIFLIAALDYLYQRFEYMKNLRMSKQEIKEEYKQQEGDPHLKQKLKQIRMERARGRMMAAVPKADVVITNPTHYAVALKYEPDSMRAPVLIAKGTDTAAQRIKEIAFKNKIPVLRNPVLARSLYADVEVDASIPQQHYMVVAKIISYVFKLKGKKMPGGSTGGRTPAHASGTIASPQGKKKTPKAKKARKKKTP